MDELLDLLKDINEEIDFESEDTLMDDELLSSEDIENIVEMLEDEYDIDISEELITPDNFNSAESIYRLIRSLQ